MLHHFLRATRANSQDPYFKQVALLLHGDGTNGAQNNTFIDSSSNNFSITRNGNTTQGTFTPFSLPEGQWSNYFDGTGDYLSVPSISTLATSFTIEFWAYFSNADSTRFDFFGLGGSAVLYRPTSNTLNWYIGSDRISGSFNLATYGNRWNHIAICRDSSNNTRLFVNGTQLGSTYTSDTNTYSSTGPTIGWNSGGNHLNGYISNFRILSGTALYTSTFTPPTTPLTAITNTSLLTCQSNRFRDNSSNNFTLTRNGDVRVTAFSPFASTTAYSTSTVGGSGYFDGTGDYLSVANNAAFGFGTGDFTIETWVYPTVNARQDWIDIFNNTAPAKRVLLYYSGSAIVVYTNPPNAAAITGGALPLNQWTHLAVTKESGNMKLFVNGVQAGSTYTTNQDYGSTCAVSIGKDGSGSTVITGYQSNIRIVKGTAVYTANFTPPTAPLTAITNTSLLLNFTNAGIFDNAAKNDIETVGNAQVSTSVTKFGTGSMAFDGTGDWLTFPDRPELQLQAANFTVEAWVYLSATGSARGIVGKGTATTGWLLSTNSSNQVVFTNGSSTITSTGTLSGSTWYHIAVVRSGTSTNQTKIYINGVNDGTGTVSTTYNQTNIMYVGADRTGGSAMNGYIDDLRITNGIARYTTNFTPPQGPYPNQ